MQPYIIAVLVAAAGVFGASATSKLRGWDAYRGYRSGLRASRLIGERWLAPVAATLVAAEVVTASTAATAVVMLALRAPGARVAGIAGLVLAAGLIAVLAAGVVRSLRLGSGAPCACFGGSRPLGRIHAARNLVLLVLLLAALPMSAGDDPAGMREAVPAILAVLAGALGALLFIRADDIAELFAVAPAPRNRHH